MLQKCIFILFTCVMLNSANAQDTELEQIVSSSNKILNSQSSSQEKAEALFSIGAAYARTGFEGEVAAVFQALDK